MTTPPPNHSGNVPPNPPFQPDPFQPGAGQPNPAAGPYPNYGQQPPAGPFGQIPSGYPAPGGPLPGSPMASQLPPGPPPKSGMGKGARIAIIIGVVLAILVAATLFTMVTRNKNSGTSVETSPVGSCITISESEKSVLNVETAAIDCSDTTKLSFIVGAKLSSEDACKGADYEYWYTETGTGASDRALCLIPNLQVGECYSESSLALSVNLKTVACTETSGFSTIAFKVTERVDSKDVPNCTDPDKQKVLAYDIEKGNAEIGFCAEILGNYTWK